MITPIGFSIITPYFFVKNAESFIVFLKDAFGAVEIGRNLRDDGKIANAQLEIGKSSFMLSEESLNYPAMPASYYLYVANCDETMQAAIKVGAKLEMEAADMPYRDRQCGVRDPFGNIWWISQRLTKEPYYK